MPASTLAGVITATGTAFTAIALTITAITGLIRSRRVERKVDSVHIIVNQQRTDMQRYIRALTAVLKENDITVPVDQSVDPEEK